MGYPDFLAGNSKEQAGFFEDRTCVTCYRSLLNPQKSCAQGLRESDAKDPRPPFAPRSPGRIRYVATAMPTRYAEIPISHFPLEYTLFASKKRSCLKIGISC